MPVPYTFGTRTSAIPLSELDANFNTTATLGNAAIGLGNTTTTVGNLTLTNVTISSGSTTLTNETISGNLTLSGGTANGVVYLNTSKVATTGTAFVFDGTNVGIGTSSPLTRLDVRSASVAITTGAANFAVYSTDSQAINLGGSLLLGGNADTQIAFGVIGGRKENSTANNRDGYLQFGTFQNGIGVIERMRIDSSGRVGIGTTSPSYTLDVRATTGTISATSTTGINVTYVAANNTGGLAAIGRDSNAGGLTGTAYASFLYSDGSYPIIFSTNGTVRMRVNADAPILCLAGGNTSATGTGIAFPATQSASSDANTLDDYEEGSWTPTLTRNSSNPTVTYVNQDGKYVKIGRMVYASCLMQWSGNTGGSGVNWFISGLPFTNSNGAAHYAQGTIQDFDGITFAAGRTQFGGYVNSAETRFYLSCGGSNQLTTDVTPGNSGYIYMSVVYIASA